VEQAEKYLGAVPRDVEATGFTDLDAAIAYAQKGPVKDPGDLRGVAQK